MPETVGCQAEHAQRVSGETKEGSRAVAAFRTYCSRTGSGPVPARSCTCPGGTPSQPLAHRSQVAQPTQSPAHSTVTTPAAARTRAPSPQNEPCPPQPHLQQHAGVGEGGAGDGLHGGHDHHEEGVGQGEPPAVEPEDGDQDVAQHRQLHDAPAQGKSDEGRKACRSEDNRKNGRRTTSVCGVGPNPDTDTAAFWGTGPAALGRAGARRPALEMCRRAAPGGVRAATHRTVATASLPCRPRRSQAESTPLTPMSSAASSRPSQPMSTGPPWLGSGAGGSPQAAVPSPAATPSLPPDAAASSSAAAAPAASQLP